MPTAEHPEPGHQSLAEQMRASRTTHEAVETPLRTSERILARITDGIYRQPASALRELISNAYDADATEVVILTDAPRFSSISIRDNGLGLTPESLEHLFLSIGDSAKRTEKGAELDLASQNDQNKSRGGRQFIGKMGIGLFSVAQFTRHFLIITKTRGDTFRTVADITLGAIDAANQPSGGEITTGHVKIWQEPASDVDTQGTEIKLLNLLPRTRAELSSQDLWSRIDYEQLEDGKATSKPPKLHIGRVDPAATDTLLLQPHLPWSADDNPQARFAKLVSKVRSYAESDPELADLTSVCDRYLQTLWVLALAAPVKYLEEHPFDLKPEEDLRFFRLENKLHGQSSPLNLAAEETPRSKMHLGTPWLQEGDQFEVSIDGVQLLRPIIYRKLPKTDHAIKQSLLFVGQCREAFLNKPVTLTGGPLEFEAYLFWTPKVVPTQHQGVMIRVGNASGSPFDSTFMGYQVSEQTRLRQITAEIFVHEGLDGAINIDRESFNYAHPHYQYLVKWLHSAIRQLTNRNKEIGKKVREVRKENAGQAAKAKLAARVDQILLDRGVEDVVDVKFVKEGELATHALRKQGAIVFHKERVIPPLAPQERNTGVAKQKVTLLEQKAIAVTQILQSWGLLNSLAPADQEKLVSEIIEVMNFEVEL